MYCAKDGKYYNSLMSWQKKSHVIMWRQCYSNTSEFFFFCSFFVFSKFGFPRPHNHASKFTAVSYFIPRESRLSRREKRSGDVEGLQ